MPIDSRDLEPALSSAEEAFRRGGQKHEVGLDVGDASLVQLRKACRSISGAESLLPSGYYTLVVEVSFTSMEKTLLFWLLQERHRESSTPPGSHTTAIDHSAQVGFVDDEVADRLAELWRANRVQTYYREARATHERGVAMLELASRLHALVVDLAGVRHECVCD